MKSRRDFLRIGVNTLTAATAVGAIGKFSAMNAWAATGPYQALVCVYLSGGNDGHNMLAPITTSQQNYTAYAAARQGLAIPQASLLQIGTKKGDTYGLNPMMPELQSLYTAGKAAILANVGMLVIPLPDKNAFNQYPAGSPNLPVNLFSHSDQTSQWQSAQPNGVSATGWGGRLADFLAGSYNSAGQFPAVVNNGGCGLYCTGAQTLPGVVPSQGPAGLTGVGNNVARQQGIQQLLTFDNGLQLVQAANSIQNRGVTEANLLNNALAAAPALQTVFPSGNQLGNQLKMAARIIGVRSQLGLGRQIFFCNLGGFDTHSNQLNAYTGQTPLLQQLSQALAAFYNATVELGVAQNVTAFTASEFGRTVMPNGNAGTDHAWGSHHIILGGSVLGGDIYGQYPMLTTGNANPLDVTGRGSLIPTTAVDQYAATLAQWFGVAQANLPAVLPNVNNFAAQNLGFLG
ncbi:MAG: DUF1501 domain-containing protein [Bryobacteraceae bacterium]